MLTTEQQLAVIDFQDMVLGPACYDVVSLLRDCYISLTPAQVEQLLLEYQQLMAPTQPQIAALSWPELKQYFDWIGLQRHLKVCGIFCRLYYRDGKAGYLADLPRVLNYIVQVAQQYRQLQPLSHWLQQQVLPVMTEVETND